MRFEQIVTKTMACLLTAFIWVGCGDAEPSASFQEAQKIHEQLDRLASGLHDELQMTIEEAEAQIQASLNAGDSLLALQLGRIDGQLGALDVRFHDWESTVVALPGAACDHDHDRPRHDHGHDHDHDHDHGHDHDHDHDHGTGASLEGMSDEAILEIQQALLLELTAMESLLKEAKSALQIQDTDGDAE